MHDAMSRRVTHTEFLVELATLGYARTARWHEDWIELGLLDRGRSSARRGGGATYTWPHSQVELAAALLAQAARGVARGALPKLVVFVWLWYGDDYVSFRQVPRAMRTWAHAEANAPVKHIRVMANDLVNHVAHKHGSGRRRLVRALVDFPTTGDPEILRAAWDDVFDPERTGWSRGPQGAALNTDGYLMVLGFRQRAVANLGRYTQQQYGGARQMYRNSRAEYALAQPGYALDKDLGRMHAPFDLSELADSACQDLLSCLGLLYEQDTPAKPSRERRASAQERRDHYR